MQVFQKSSGQMEEEEEEEKVGLTTGRASYGQLKILPCRKNL